MALLCRHDSNIETRCVLRVQAAADSSADENGSFNDDDGDTLSTDPRPLDVRIAEQVSMQLFTSNPSSTEQSYRAALAEMERHLNSSVVQNAACQGIRNGVGSVDDARTQLLLSAGVLTHVVAALYQHPNSSEVQSCCSSALRAFLWKVGAREDMVALGAVTAVLRGVSGLLGNPDTGAAGRLPRAYALSDMVELLNELVNVPAARTEALANDGLRLVIAARGAVPTPPSKAQECINSVLSILGTDKEVWGCFVVEEQDVAVDACVRVVMIP